jgi:hypothetical protein
LYINLVIVRALTEWTGTNQQGIMDQTSIREGIGGITTGVGFNYLAGTTNTRQAYIQGFDNIQTTTNSGAGANFVAGLGSGAVPNESVPYGVTQPTVLQRCCTRRYQISFALGLFTQDKLIPTKWMASQLAVELTLENAASCMISLPGTSSGIPPTYTVTGVNLIPEILEFDSSYDAMFLKGCIC